MARYRIYGQVYEAPSPEDAFRQHAAKNSPNMVSGLAQQFNQGISLGTADEAQAGFEAALTDATYRDAMERQRREREAFASKNPYLSAAATATGALLPTAAATFFGGPVGGAATGSRALNMTLNALYGGGNALRNVSTVKDAVREGARYGVPIGMITGAASANPDERIFGALQGGALGGAVGGGFGGATQGAAALSNRLSPYSQKVVNFLNLANRPTGSQMAASSGTVTQPFTAAEMKILAALERSGMTPEVAAIQLARARETGVPLGLVDVGGQNVQRMARGVRSAGGEGGEIVDTALANRAGGQRDRVVNFLERALGRKASGDAGTVSDQLLTQARTESSPFYKQLGSLPELDDPKILSTFQIPAVVNIIRKAEADRLSFGRKVNPLYDAQGNLLRRPTFEDVDLVKQNIDAMLQPQYQMGPRPQDSVNVSTRDVRNMATDLNRSMVAAADAAPFGNIYANARASYAAPAQARDFYNQGGQFPEAQLADIRAITSTASPANLKFYQRGVIEALRRKIDSMSDLTSQPNVLRSFYGDKEARNRLEAIVPSRRAEKLREQLVLENQAARTKDFVRGGSPTIDKGIDLQDVADDGAKKVAQTLTSSVKQKIAESVADVYGQLQTSVNEKTRAEIARQLTNFDNPAAQQAFLMRLRELQAQGNLRAQDVAVTARAIAAQKELE